MHYATKRIDRESDSVSFEELGGEINQLGEESTWSCDDTNGDQFMSSLSYST